MSKKTKLRKRSSIRFTQPSMTKQSFKDECDIGNILRRHEGGLPVNHVMSGVPQFGDFSDIPEYSESLALVKAAQDAFMALPSAVRKRFGHDPQNLIEFVTDDSNRDEAIRLGLLRPLEAPLLRPLEAPLADGAKKTGAAPPKDGESVAE